MNTALIKIFSAVQSLMTKEGLDLKTAQEQVLSQREHTHTFVLGDPVLFHAVTMVLDNDSGFPIGISERALTEFVHSPELSYIQMAMESSNIGANYFSEGIGWLTDIMYREKFKHNALLGLMIPFVGHNGYIRTQSLLDQNGWSERHVAEDYIFAMNEVAKKGVQAGRYVDYPDMRFTEEVTTTLNPQMSKTFRYAFGTLEMLMNNVSDWRSGVFQKTFKSIFSSGKLSFGTKAFLFADRLFYMGTASMALALLFAPLSGTTLVLALGPIVFFTVGGSFAIWQAGLFDKPEGGISIKKLIKGIYHSTLLGTMNMAVGSYYSLKSFFWFFIPGEKIFPATAKENLQAGSFREALRNIGAETHYRVVSIAGIFGTQMAILSVLGVSYFSRAADFMNTSTIVFAVALPYLLDVGLMSYIGKQIRSKVQAYGKDFKILDRNDQTQDNVDSQGKAVVDVVVDAAEMLSQDSKVSLENTGGVDFSDWTMLKRTGSMSMGIWKNFSINSVGDLEGVVFDFVTMEPLAIPMVSGLQGAK